MTTETNRGKATDYVHHVRGGLYLWVLLRPRTFKVGRIYWLRDSVCDGVPVMVKVTAIRHNGALIYYRMLNADGTLGSKWMLSADDAFASKHERYRDLLVPVNECADLMARKDDPTWGAIVRAALNQTRKDS